MCAAAGGVRGVGVGGIDGRGCRGVRRSAGGGGVADGGAVVFFPVDLVPTRCSRERKSSQRAGVRPNGTVGPTHATATKCGCRIETLLLRLRAETPTRSLPPLPSLRSVFMSLQVVLFFSRIDSGKHRLITCCVLAGVPLRCFYAPGDAVVGVWKLVDC